MNSTDVPASEVKPVSSFPQKLSLSLAIELEVWDQDTLEYVQNPDPASAGEPQIGFLADLFDLLGEQLDVITINGKTLGEIQKILTAELP